MKIYYTWESTYKNELGEPILEGGNNNPNLLILMLFDKKYKIQKIELLERI